MHFRGRVLLAIAAGAIGLTAVRVPAIEFDPIEWCQVRLSVMGRKFFRQWSGEIALCQERRMKGEVPESAKCYPDDIVRPDPTTYCQQTVDAAVDPNYQRRLCRAEEHSHDKVQRKCKDEFLSHIPLGVPCGTVATVTQLQDCIDFDAHGAYAIDFTRTVFGAVGRVEDEKLRDCIKSLFTVGQNYSRKVMQTMGEKCEVLVMAGRQAPPCPNAAAQKRLNKARRLFAKEVLAACQNFLDDHRVAFGAPCDGLGPTATASDYVDCLAGAAEDTALRGVGTVWYGN